MGLRSQPTQRATHNTASGIAALGNNNSGDNNTADGSFALGDSIGKNNNIALGFYAGWAVGSNNIDIGNKGVVDEANTIRIGNAIATVYPDGSTHPAQTAAYIAGISGKTVPSGVTVIVGTDGHLGTVTSSARFKEAIRPMDKASEAILALKPVTFHYKPELDPDAIPQFGLIAEQVEKVNPDLVVRDADGKVNTVRYEAVNAMLLNEFLKEHRNVEEQQTKLAQQQSTIAELKTTVAQQQSQIAAQRATAAQQQKQIEALIATVQKVSEQFELSAPAPQIAANED